MAHAKAAALESIEQNLAEEIAVYLESESVLIDEAIAGIAHKDHEGLHKRMARAAMAVYLETVDGWELLRNQGLDNLLNEKIQ